jgi:translation initiation factor IF-2
MAEDKMIRLGQASRKLNVGHNTILEFLAKKGYTVENNPNAKLTGEQFAMLSKEYASSASEKIEAHSLTIGTKHAENLTIKVEADAHRKKAEEEDRILIKNLGSKDIVKHKEEAKPEKIEADKPKLEGIKVLGKIELETDKKKTEKIAEAPVAAQPKAETKAAVPDTKQQDQELIKAKADKLKGLKVVDKIELPAEKEKKKEAPVASSDVRGDDKKKRPRKRIPTPAENKGQRPGQRPLPPRVQKAEPTEKEIQDQIRQTLAKLSGGQKKFSGAKYRKEKRQAVSEAEEERIQKEQEASKVLKVSEFISANDLASMMNVSVNDVISTCLGLGMFVSINQRLDAEAITVIADEFGYDVQFVSAEDEVEVEEAPDAEEDLQPRAPIVTIMGHRLHTEHESNGPGGGRYHSAHWRIRRNYKERPQDSFP